MFPTTTSKKLGLVKAVHSGITPPENKLMLWVDLSVRPFIHKYFNEVANDWIPLNDSGNGTGLGVNVGETVLFVAKTGNDNTAEVGSLNKTFLSVGGAYNKAKTLSPSTIKRITIVVYPGSYDEDLIIDTNCIDIVGAIEEEQIYNRELAIKATTNNGVDYNYTHGGRNVQLNSIQIRTTNTLLMGFNLDFLRILCLGVQTFNVFQNMWIQTINHDMGGETNATVHAHFYDIHSLNWFLGEDTLVIKGTYIRSGCARGFNTNVDLYGVVTGATFKEFYCGNDSFITGDKSGSINGCIFENIISGANNFQTVNNCSFIECELGAGNVKSIINSTVLNTKAGINCFDDFLNVIFKDSTVGLGFGANGSLSVLKGSLNNVKGDYSTGFAAGRMWRGDMKNMLIECTINGAALSVSSSQEELSIIEYSKIKNCGDGGTINGNYAEISYCKLNKNYSIQNTLGTIDQSFNIVEANLCGFDPGETGFDTCPTVTNLKAVNNKGILVVTWDTPVSSANNPTLSYLVQYYKEPDGQKFQFETNSSPFTKEVLPGAEYKVRVITTCLLSTSGQPPFISSTQVSTQKTAWRGRESDAFCIQSFASYSIENYDDATGAHNVKRTFDDGNGSVTWNYTVQNGPTTVNYSTVFAPNQLSRSVPSNGVVANNMVTNESWIGRAPMGNTGYRRYKYIEEYYVGGLNNGQLTGNIALNPYWSATDITSQSLPPAPDVYDTTSCPVHVNGPIEPTPTIYAQLNQYNEQTSTILETCIVDVPPYTVGYKITRDLTVYFYSDAGGSVPMNISGLGITQLKIKKTVTDSITMASTESILTINITPTFNASCGVYEVLKKYWGCAGDPGSTPDIITGFELLSVSGQYTAL